MTQDRDEPDRKESAPGEPGPTASEGEAFVARWSRRKWAARTGDTSTGTASLTEQSAARLDAGEEAHAVGAAPETGAASPSSAEPREGPIKDPPSPPPLESLHADSDYSAFLSPKVGEELRRLALRKLFGSSKFNLRDGLDDYDDDYRIFESLGDIVTADMRHRMAVASTRDPDASPSTHALASEQAGASPAGADERARSPGDEQVDEPADGDGLTGQATADAPPGDTAVGEET